MQSEGLVMQLYTDVLLCSPIKKKKEKKKSTQPNGDDPPQRINPAWLRNSSEHVSKVQLIQGKVPNKLRKKKHHEK